MGSLLLSVVTVLRSEASKQARNEGRKAGGAASRNDDLLLSFFLSMKEGVGRSMNLGE